MKEARASALLTKSMEAKIFAEVFGEIRYKIKKECGGVEVSSIRKRKAGRILIELGPKKMTRTRSIRQTLSEITLVSSLESISS